MAVAEAEAERHSHPHHHQQEDGKDAFVRMFRQGVTCEEACQLEDAITWFRRAALCAEEHKQHARASVGWHRAALAFQIRGKHEDYAHAIDCHARQLTMAVVCGTSGDELIVWEEMNASERDRMGESVAYGGLGAAHYARGEYEKAAECYWKDVSACMDLGDRRREGMAYRRLGWVFQAMGEYKRAADTHGMNLGVAVELEDRIEQIEACANLRNAHWSLGNVRTAVRYHESFLRLSRGDSRSSTPPRPPIFWSVREFRMAVQ